jgi:hypothetical protein
LTGFEKRTRKLRLALYLAISVIGCTTAKEASGPVVLEIKGSKMTRDEVRWAYDHQNQAGAFETATPAQRAEFLGTLGDKEVLLAYARERSRDLPPAETMQLREKNEYALLKALEHAVVGPIQQDSVAAYYLERFHRQLHLMIFITPSDSVAKMARALVVSGTPFSDVVMKYCKDPQVLERKGDVGWKTPESIGREFAMELWVEERAAGYLSELRQTPGGYIFYQVLGVREADLSGNDMIPKMLAQLAQLIRSYNGMMAHLDSLRQANGLEIMDANIPVLMKGMNGYWDSLGAVVRAEGKRPTTFTPPLSRFSAEERATPLYKLRKTTHSVGEFVQSLRDIAPKQWPMGEDLDAVRKQIDFRVLSTLQIEEARARGLDRDMDYVMTAKGEEEKLRLGEFVVNAVSKDVTVTPEAIRAYYDANLEKYRTKELIRFSYAIFPTKAEATELAKEGMKRDLNWWGDQLQLLQKNRPDVIVKFNSPQYDLTMAVPDTVQTAVKAAWDKSVGEVADAQPTLGNRWIVPRVTYRQRAGITPFEKVKSSIEATLKDQELDRRIGKLVEEGKPRFGLKLYPERLESKG